MFFKDTSAADRCIQDCLDSYNKINIQILKHKYNLNGDMK